MSADSPINPDCARLEDWKRAEAEMRRRLPAHLSREEVERAVRKRRGHWYHRRLIQEDVARAKAENGEFVAKIQTILAQADPIAYSGYPGYDPGTAYEKEAGLISSRLGDVKTLEDLENIVVESFVRGQAPLDVQGSFYLTRFADVTRKIWAVL